jgi:hypothetical protein
LRHVEKRGLRQRRYLPCAVIWLRPAHREKLAGVLGREWRQEIKIRNRHKKFDQVRTFLSSDDAAMPARRGNNRLLTAVDRKELKFAVHTGHQRGTPTKSHGAGESVKKDVVALRMAEIMIKIDEIFDDGRRAVVEKVRHHYSDGKSVRRATPMPCGSRPSMAALTRSGVRKASEIVMVYFADAATLTLCDAFRGC